MRTFTIALLFAAATSGAFSQDQPAPQQEYEDFYYYGRLSTGVLVGNYVNTVSQISAGYRFRHLEIGLGLGSERHVTGNFVPLFLESRWDFGKRRTQPFVGLTAGFLAPTQRFGYNAISRYAGLTAGASFGITRFFTQHFGMMTLFGYRAVVLPVQSEGVLWQQGGEFRMGVVFR